MEIGPKRSKVVVLRDFVELKRQREEARTEAPAADAETIEKAPRADDPKPKFGGLHRLAVLEMDPDDPPPDFTTYRIGFNNRSLLGGIARGLNRRFGTDIMFGYGARLESSARHRSSSIGFERPDHFVVGEADIDAMVAKVNDPIERRAVATFAIAHEFFHSLLRHADFVTLGRPSPPGFKVKASGYRKLFEFQVDYLAARYLRTLGLPIEPMVKEFETGKYETNEDYPSGPERAANVKTAMEDDFRGDLFDNDIVDCLAFLDSIVKR